MKVGHDFAARSCSDLDLKGETQMLRARRQHGGHFFKIVSKSDFK